MRTARIFGQMVVAPALAVAGGCAADLGQITSASTVADYTNDTSCSTAVVFGLSRQIADELACARPGALVAFESSASLVFTNSAVLPYLEPDANDELNAVAAATTLHLNSAFRTVAQQYLLVQWFHQGRCGITAAAAVGTSNHETGRALDLATADAEVAAMAAGGWAHDVPGDDAHFDHAASADLRGEDVAAFQRLWNRNHAGDAIAEDGLYGPQTEARLQQAPATGFALGADCGAQPTQTNAAEVRAIHGADRAPPLTRVPFTITIANTGTAILDADTKLAISGASSQLHDASWLSATTVTTLGAPLAPGELADVAFTVMTPNVTVETPIAQKLVLDNGARFGSIDIAITVAPAGSPPAPTSGDGNEPPTGWTPPDESGGCATTHGGSPLLVLAIALLLRRRR